jgi:hypothetical protein
MREALYLWILLLRLIAQEAEDDQLLDTDIDFPDDQVDQWEAVPLPPPSESDLIRDSDELYSMHQSDVKRMMEKEEQYVQSLARGGHHPDIEDEHELEDLEAELMEQDAQAQIKPSTPTEQPELPTIFNTDDFDDEYDDVPGDAPVAPLNLAFI